MQLPDGSTTPSIDPPYTPTAARMRTPNASVAATALSPPVLPPPALPPPAPAAPAPTNNFGPNVSVGRRPPLVSELVKPRSHVDGQEYHIVTVGTQVGIFQTLELARASMEHVIGGSVKSKGSWYQAVVYYGHALSKNAVHVRDATPSPSSAPGNSVGNPISILSGASSPTGAALFHYSPFRIADTVATPTPNPAIRSQRVKPPPVLKFKGKATTSRRLKAKATTSEAPSAAATRVRKRKAAQDPASQKMRRTINSGADTSDDGAYVVSRRRSPPLSFISGPTPIVKPAPRPEDVIVIRGSSEEATPPADPVVHDEVVKASLKKTAKKPAARDSSDNDADDDAPSATAVQQGKKPQKPFQHVNIITTADVERAFEAKVAREAKMRLDARLKRAADHRANAQAFKLAMETKRTAEASASGSVNASGSASASGSRPFGLRAHTVNASGSASASGSRPFGLHAHTDSSASGSRPFNPLAHMDGKPQVISDVFHPEAHMDGKSVDAHMDGKSDDEYVFDDLDLTEAGEEELTRVLAAPLVPSPSKFKAMGTIRRLEAKKHHM